MISFTTFIPLKEHESKQSFSGKHSNKSVMLVEDSSVESFNIKVAHNIFRISLKNIFKEAKKSWHYTK